MNRIDYKFSELKEKDEKAFITFITAGDPDIETTKKLVLEMEKNGADIIELGIPFSDPIAEGPVIQSANVRALEKGINTDIIMDAVKDLRAETQIPIVYLLYYNSIYAYGLDRFFKRCKECGIDGVIIPDLPYEECGEIAEYTEKYGVYQISLIAPTSTPVRIKNICKDAKGFIYCVSSLGVTGERASFSTDFEKMFEFLNSCTDIPKCIGFGISTPEHIKTLKDFCDGLIVGSAIVKKVEHGKTNDEKINDVGKLTHLLKSAF